MIDALREEQMEKKSVDLTERTDSTGAETPSRVDALYEAHYLNPDERYIESYAEMTGLARALERELSAARRDGERLDYLDSLTRRTWKNHAGAIWPIGSDMHFSKGSVSLYVRNEVGNAVNSGGGDTVRGCIDAALSSQ